MSTKPPLTSLDRVVTEVQVLSNVARSKRTCISIEELEILTSSRVTTEQILQLLEGTSTSSSGSNLESGLGGRRDKVDNLDLALRKRRSESNAWVGAHLLSLCNRKHSKLLSISGSTSYHSASADDDLDFFCITETGETWLFLAKSLLLARVFRLIHPSSPRTCFSYVIDDEYAKWIFATARNALFARDALTAIITHGADYYARLLQESTWISKYFPKLYRAKARPTARADDHEESHVSPTMSLLNSLAFEIVGGYIRLKSYMRNLSIKKHGSAQDNFKADIGRDHCIYESNSYSNLRTMYQPLDERVSMESKP